MGKTRPVAAALAATITAPGTGFVVGTHFVSEKVERGQLLPLHKEMMVIIVVSSVTILVSQQWAGVAVPVIAISSGGMGAVGAEMGGEITTF